MALFVFGFSYRLDHFWIKKQKIFLLTIRFISSIVYHFPFFIDSSVIPLAASYSFTRVKYVGSG
jgi:hypothetical protein